MKQVLLALLAIGFVSFLGAKESYAQCQNASTYSIEQLAVHDVGSYITVKKLSDNSVSDFLIRQQAAFKVALEATVADRLIGLCTAGGEVISIFLPTP